MTSDARPEALASGRICAVAARAERQMRDWAAGYPDLFAAEIFDPTMFHMCALASAFSGPWYDADQLRMANRVTLWGFGFDHLVDEVATDRAEAEAVIGRVEAVAGGAAPAPGDDLTRFLAELRDELAPHHPLWRDELRSVLGAVRLHWEWREEGRLPSFEEYLATADDIAYSLVFAAHWAVNGANGDVEAVREASWAVQRAVRLLNDLASYERDRRSGDLNALLLGLDREKVRERAAELTGEAVRLIAPLPPEHGGYLRRQLEFCTGFYGATDFWGVA